jgi:hypothetical protein
VSSERKRRTPGGLLQQVRAEPAFGALRSRTRTTRWWQPPALFAPLQEGQVGVQESTHNTEGLPLLIHTCSPSRTSFFLWRGFIYSKGAREPQSISPEGGGGANNRGHPNRIRRTCRRSRSELRTESWPCRSSRAWHAGGRGVVAAVELPVTDEGGSGEGRG